MNKINLFLDFDEVIVDSINPILKILNQNYNTNYVPHDVQTWNMQDLFPNLKVNKLEELFESDIFWDNVTFKYNAYKTIKALTEFCNIYIVSKGTFINLYKKYEWIKTHLISNGINVYFHGLDLSSSKGSINMRDSIIVDDHQINLAESNALYKILFINYPDKEWNNQWDGFATSSWNHLYWVIRDIYKLTNGNIEIKEEI